MTGAVLSECGQKLNRVAKNWTVWVRERGGTAAARTNGDGGGGRYEEELAWKVL
jgi:hypothetical protein